MHSIFAPNSGAHRDRAIPKQRSPTTSRRQSAFETIQRSLRRKSEVDVVLDDGDDFIRTYSTFDQIKGHVNLKFEKDTLIDDLHIFLEGQSNTYVEKIATAAPTTGRTTGRHVFLRVQQPIPQHALPADNLARADVTYTIPFHFTVPDRLLPYVCCHKVEHESVKKAHLQLPPSIGDPMLAGDGNILMDDLSPEMAKVIYSIKARVLKSPPNLAGRSVDVEEKVVRIRIVPAREDEPPMTIDEENASYVMRAEKNVRKGLFKIGKKLGRLTAEAAQPESLRLPHPAKRSTAPVTTMTTIKLRFDPATENEQPPQLANLASKLRVYTFFGATCYRMIPEIGRCDNWSSLHGTYPENVELSSRNVGSVTWIRHGPDGRKKSTVANITESSRRESVLSTTPSSSSASSDSTPDPSASYDPTLPFYTAKVLVPITLPTSTTSEEQVRRGSNVSNSKSASTMRSRKVVFLPTFHTCIISRTYALELNLSFHPVTSTGTTSQTLGAPSVRIRTPIQISQEGSNPPQHNELYDLHMADFDNFESMAEDEALARQLDRELNFTNPFISTNRPFHEEVIPEYEEVQTSLPPGFGERANSVAVPFSATQSHSLSPSQSQEQPPNYFSPFRSNLPGRSQRRVSVRS